MSRPHRGRRSRHVREDVRTHLGHPPANEQSQERACGVRRAGDVIARRPQPAASKGTRELGDASKTPLRSRRESDGGGAESEWRRRRARGVGRQPGPGPGLGTRRGRTTPPPGRRRAYAAAAEETASGDSPAGRRLTETARSTRMPSLRDSPRGCSGRCDRRGRRRNEKSRERESVGRGSSRHDRSREREPPAGAPGG